MKAIYLLLTLSLLMHKLIAAPFFESGTTPWGADSELLNVNKERPESKKLKLTLAQKSCRAMIRFFQVYISDIDGPRSSFYPTSSQYALEAIEKYGIFKGIAMGCDRLMRENGEMWVYETTDQYGIERKLDPVR
jgi:uncharacterized protein